MKTPFVPQILFAHNFQADKYANRLLPASGLYEICYYHTDSFYADINKTRFTPQKNSVIIIDRSFEACINAPSFHEHSTVGFYAPEGVIPPNIIGKEIKNCSGKIRAAVYDLIKEYTLSPHSRLRLGGMLFLLLDMIDTHCNNTCKTNNVSGLKYFNKAKNYIFENLHRALSLSEISAYLNISREYLCAVFNKNGGMPPIRYISEIKLQKIKNIIQTTGCTLKCAAENFGYSNPDYVSRLYKKYYGSSLKELMETDYINKN